MFHCFSHPLISKWGSLNVKVNTYLGNNSPKSQALHNVCVARCFRFQPLGIKICSEFNQREVILQ